MESRVSDAAKIANMVMTGRKGERGIDYFRGFLRETDKKEFSFTGIERKIVRRHPR